MCQVLEFRFHIEVMRLARPGLMFLPEVVLLWLPGAHQAASHDSINVSALIALKSVMPLATTIDVRSPFLRPSMMSAGRMR